MSEVVAIYGDALLDPASGDATRTATVLIEDGRVVRTGPRDQVAVPRDAQVVDAERSDAAARSHRHARPSALARQRP